MSRLDEFLRLVVRGWLLRSPTPPTICEQAEGGRNAKKGSFVRNPKIGVSASDSHLLVDVLKRAFTLLDTLA